jgi:DNA repair protein RadC
MQWLRTRKNLPGDGEKSADGGTNCRSLTAFRLREGHNFIDQFDMARRLLSDMHGILVRPFGVCVMFPAIGAAAAAAFDAVQSLTSKKKPSSPDTIGFASALANPKAASQALSSASHNTGYTKSSVSANDINALLGSQNHPSSDSEPSSDTKHSAATLNQSRVVYNAIDQLRQSAGVPVGHNPVSLRV